ncbi:alpha/beta fold hydrolase [Magnetospirillum sp. UT-4]|uniref:alpha/beta fold hydrolase n=1 Tax=Magnetospirillum sp. UT-4 TaxID=2681467 RepID=UPI00352D45B9
MPLLRTGSLPWNPALAKAAESLRAGLAGAGPDEWTEFDKAIEAEGVARHQAVLDGIELYRRHPYRRALPPPAVLWRQGTTSVLDFRAGPEPGSGGLPVLVIPSLINRSYILDLTARRSLLRYLAAHGFAPFLVDWDAPGAEETGFDLTDYIAGRLCAALDAVVAATGGTVALVGYCMGGDLALALAQLRPDAVSALALLATPWDFHASREAHGALMRALAGPLGRVIAQVGNVPVDMLQSMFAALDPTLNGRKFAAFARLPQRRAKARDFVALEDWANDGVALAGPVAHECLFGWYGDNTPARGGWRVAGRVVSPAAIRCPTLAIIPERDRIVPPDSALPLAAAIPGCRLVTVKGGHVGMLLSSRAKTEVYGPLAKWLVRSALHNTGCATPRPRTKRLAVISSSDGRNDRGKDSKRRTLP